MSDRSSALSEAQLLQFVHEGYVRIDEAFDRHLAEECREILWSQIGLSPEEPSTWSKPVIRVGFLAQPPFRAAANTPRLIECFDALVGAFERTITLKDYTKLNLAGGASPSDQSGASGTGQLYLNASEDAELNTHLPAARDLRMGSGAANLIASSLTPIPSAEAHLAFWGIGVHSKITSGEVLGAVAKIAAEVLQIEAAYETDQAGIASRTASYLRRADDWLLQANLAARELMQIFHPETAVRRIN